MIERLTATTFKSTMANFSEVIVGNENSSKFEPHIRLKKWGEETYLGFGIPTTKNFQSSFAYDSALDTDVVQWIDTDADRKYRFYDRRAAKGEEHGGFEFEIWLASPPSEMLMDFPADLSGLNLHYQPSLSDFEIKRGNTRPENVVGSYAAYHLTKGGLHSAPGAADKYRVGKAFHIYRPEAIDANGDRHWLDLVHDPVNSKLSILIDGWFATAAYPVCIDPSIGYTSLGGSSDNTNQFALANKFVAPSGGDANPGTAYIGGDFSPTTASVYVGVYDLGDGNVSGNNRLAVSSAITLIAVTGFRSAAITWTGIVNGTTYYIEAFSNTNNVRISYDNTGATDEYIGTTTATPPDPHGTRDGTQTLTPSVYVDYTASGGSKPKQLTTLGVGNILPVYTVISGLEWLRKRKNKRAA